MYEYDEEVEQYVAANGVNVAFVDMGVEYKYNGNTLTIIGEAGFGEWTLEKDGTTRNGDYEVVNGYTVMFDEVGGVLKELGHDEEEWDKWAFTMLA